MSTKGKPVADQGSKPQAATKPRRSEPTVRAQRNAGSAAEAPAPQGGPTVVDVRVTNPGDMSGAGATAHYIGEPFWMRVPKVAYFWAKFLLFPLTALKFVMEMALCAILLGVFAVLGMWATGHLSQEEVMPYVSDFGDRTLELMRALGFPL